MGLILQVFSAMGLFVYIDFIVTSLSALLSFNKLSMDPLFIGSHLLQTGIILLLPVWFILLWFVFLAYKFWLKLSELYWIALLIVGILVWFQFLVEMIPTFPLSVSCWLLVVTHYLGGVQEYSFYTQFVKFFKSWNNVVFY